MFESHHCPTPNESDEHRNPRDKDGNKTNHEVEVVVVVVVVVVVAGVPRVLSAPQFVVTVPEMCFVSS